VKINLLRRGQHWSDLADLGILLPVTAVFKDLHESENREVNLRFVERAGAGLIAVHVASMAEEEHIPSVVRMELRAVLPVHDNLEQQFLAANTALNERFFKLISEHELGRFCGRERG
jgi:hypothetical protein